MTLPFQTILLFSLNAIDALLTVYWVRHGFATEGNRLMAGLLEMGDAPFLTVKIVMGAIAAIVLARWGNLKVAQYGLTAALAIYLCLMGVHLFTGLSAFGYISENFMVEFNNWSQNLFC